MYVVTEKHLNEARANYKDAADEIDEWRDIATEARWHNFEEVRIVYKDARNVDGYVIFEFRHNRYRLITVTHYAKTTKKKKTQGHIYIRSFFDA